MNGARLQASLDDAKQSGQALLTREAASSHLRGSPAQREEGVAGVCRSDRASGQNGRLEALKGAERGDGRGRTG